jgi:hypothetical protein
MKNIFKIKLLLMLCVVFNIACSDDDEQALIKNSPIENFTAESNIESVTLSWDVPAGNVNSFIISYNPDGESIILEDVTSNEITIDGLDGGTEYTFSIWWIDGSLDPSEIVFLTATPEIRPPGTFNGDLVFGNQSELDNFELPDEAELQNIVGNLIIASDGTDDIFDLSSLDDLILVTGAITINNNPILSNLDDFSALTTIEVGSITIQNNRNLVNFCGLSNLASTISAVISTNGFNVTLDEILTGNCQMADLVYDNPNNDRFNTQAEIDALPDNITSVAGELIIGLDASTNDITDLSKFSKLRRIEGRLIIQRSPLLTDFAGLTALEFIGSTDSDELVIRQMDGLLTLDGLQALSHVGRRIGIRENPVLATLEGLSNIRFIGENKLTIGDCGNANGGNPLLTDYCALQGVVERFSVGQLEMSGSCIDSFSSFNPSFQDILDGNCSN